jgi:hypothetical protein
MPPGGIAGAVSFFGLSATNRFGGDQERGDRGRILECNAYDLGRVNDAGRNHVDIFFLLGVKAEIARLLYDLSDHDRALNAGILRDLTDRRFKSLGHDVDASLDVEPLALFLLDCQCDIVSAAHDPANAPKRS